MTMFPAWLGIGGVLTVLIYAFWGMSLRDNGIVPTLWTMGLTLCFPVWLLIEASYCLLKRKVLPRTTPLGNEEMLRLTALMIIAAIATTACSTPLPTATPGPSPTPTPTPPPSSVDEVMTEASKGEAVLAKLFEKVS